MKRQRLRFPFRVGRRPGVPSHETPGSMTPDLSKENAMPKLTEFYHRSVSSAFIQQNGHRRGRFGWLTVLGLSVLTPAAVHAQSGNVLVDSRCNIFGYGVLTPQPGGGGGGVTAVTINLTPGTNRALTLSANGSAWWNGSAGSNGPDGGGFASRTTVPAVGPISGYSAPRAGHLVALFLEPGDPSGQAAPASFGYPNAASLNGVAYSPLIRQVFYVGDGQTATGAGTTQTFRVPDSADRLVLGIADARSFNGSAGSYDDNRGAYNVSYAVGSQNVLALYTFEDSTFRDTSVNDVLTERVIGSVGYNENGLEGISLSSTDSVLRAGLNINPSVHPRISFGGWYKPFGAGGRTFISHGNLGWNRTLAMESRGGSFGWSCFTGEGVLGGLPVRFGEWNFVAVSYDDVAGTILLYANGQTRSISNRRPGSTGTNTVLIGNNPCCGNRGVINGELDNVFFVGEALSVERLAEIEAGGSREIANCAMILQQPTPALTCPRQEARLSVKASGRGGLNFQWQKLVTGVYVDVVDRTLSEGSIVSGSNTDTLTISNAGALGDGTYRVVVWNDCRRVISNSADLNVCPADFNCDDFIDLFDYSDYVTAFEVGNVLADINGDGFIDFFDYTAFITLFEMGC
jgi:hypothetical protein